MVIKTVQMDPFSRSGLTQMGYEIADKAASP
jgi:hypothetical protein